MDEQLKKLLCTYLGELLNQSENEFDWIKKGKIIKKINAARVLLDIPTTRETPAEKIFRIVTDEIKKQ